MHQSHRRCHPPSRRRATDGSRGNMPCRETPLLSRTAPASIRQCKVCGFVQGCAAESEDDEDVCRCAWVCLCLVWLVWRRVHPQSHPHTLKTTEVISRGAHQRNGSHTYTREQMCTYYVHTHTHTYTRSVCIFAPPIRHTRVRRSTNEQLDRSLILLETNVCDPRALLSPALILSLSRSAPCKTQPTAKCNGHTVANRNANSD